MIVGEPIASAAILQAIASRVDRVYHEINAECRRGFEGAFPRTAPSWRR